MNDQINNPSNKLTTCKVCGKEIAKGAKCPSCGSDNRNFFMKHEITIIIVVLFIVGVIGLTNNKSTTVVARKVSKVTVTQAATTSVARKVLKATVTQALTTATVKPVVTPNPVVVQIPPSPVVVGRIVYGYPTNLGAGSFTTGIDIHTGCYDVTTLGIGSGNFTVTSASGILNTNEVLTSDTSTIGVLKTRVILARGDVINISGISEVHFQPVASPFVTTVRTVTLSAGTFNVNQDVASGRYFITGEPGETGNFIIYDSTGVPIVNEILGAPDGVPSITLNLASGETIDIDGINGVTFIPIN